MTHSSCLSKKHRSAILAGIFPVILLFSVLLVFPGCNPAEKKDTATKENSPPEARATVDTRFEIQVGEEIVSMQLAITRPEMAKGLMFRKNLGENQGMLFVYELPRQMSFYMRNTYIDLDIGFFTADGRLREVRHMYSLDETSIKSAGNNIQFALEMNKDWFRKKGMRPGMDQVTIDLDAVAKALEQRGFEPADYGL